MNDVNNRSPSKKQYLVQCYSEGLSIIAIVKNENTIYNVGS